MMVSGASREPTAASSLLADGRTACIEGRHAEAESLLRKAVAADPSCAPALVDLGVALAAQGRHDEAAACYRGALSLAPESLHAHFNLANSLRALGQPALALGHYDEVVRLAPSFARGFTYRAVALRDTGETDEALAVIGRAVALSPDDPEGWHFCGEIRQAAGQFDAAIAAYEREMALAGEDPRTLNLLASCYQCLERYDEAVSVYRRGLALSPGDVHLLNNFGTALHAAGRVPEALEVLSRAVEVAPDNGDAHWNLALALLAAGEYASGWEEFEWRWRKNEPVLLRPCPFPLWDGAPLEGRTILLQGEQGFGDTFQFLRFAPLVAARGGRVVVECQSDALKPVVATVPGVAGVVSRGDDLPPCDLRLPLLSIPRVLGITRGNVPDEVPYCAADPAKAREWRDLLEPDRGVRVGLVWSGRQDLLRNRKRSCSLRDFSPLSRCRAVTFYSLQVGPGKEQAATPPTGLPLADLTSRINDFGDTAALIANLDLVITIDTAVAHLAGALGKPVWILLPHGADWRWLLHREDSPWYPTARLFRQEAPGQWEGVIGAIASALADAVAGDPLPAVDALVREGGDAWERGDLRRAVQLFRRAVALRPATAPLRNNLGVALQAAGERDEAESCYRAACRLAPGYAVGCYNLGYLLDESGRFGEAEEWYRAGLAAAPEDAGLHFNLAHLLLRLGRFEEGLREYEWRWEAPGFGDSRPRLPSPEWDGSPLEGKTILLTPEQGFGDTIHFIRYASLLSSRGATVIAAVPPPLVPLIAGADGVASVIPSKGAMPPHDVHIPLMALPLRCGTAMETIPAPVPYVHPAPDRVAAWRERLGGGASLQVGIFWRGGQYPENNRKRSMPLSSFAPLADLPGVSWFSLQLEEGREEAGAPPPGMHLVDLADGLTDFAETAAAVACLDLVITIDTALAHLAGAVGAPVWTLLPHVADWRWFHDRSDSPWYPTMRLFRQKRGGDWEGVMAEVRRALLFEIARRSHAAGDLDGALPLLTELVAADPAHLGGTLHLGDALHRLGRYDEALAVYDGYPLAPTPELVNNRGNALLALGRSSEAIAAYREVLRHRPGFAEAHVTIGTALQALRLPREALAEYREALAISPDLPEAHWNLALALLLLGDYEHGWPEYEWRWRKRGFTSPRREFPVPLWDGAPLEGGTILLHGEQGLGDAIQFARYVPLVAERGGRVVVECHPSLVRLFRSLPGTERVCAFGEATGDIVCHAPLMSLPHIFRTTPETIPATVPYLLPPPEMVELWRRRVGEERSFRVGLAWSGSSYPDPNRSCPLQAFAPLARCPGIELFSLQVGPGSGTVPPEGVVLRDLTAAIADFADTAALMAHLDLIVTIDTSVAHLAGALGKTTCVLLPFAPDWRWFLDRDDSPWYPTMRLFRQQAPGEWHGVMERVAAALLEEVEKAAENRLEEGVRSHEQGDLAGARVVYDGVLRWLPEHPRAAFLRGTVALQEGNPAEAENHLRAAVKGDPHRAAYRNHLGLALQRLERLDEAEEQFAAAVAGDPDPETWINLGVLRRGRNRLGEAVECFRRAVAQDERNAKAWQNLGVAEQARGQVDAAFAAYGRALEIDPSYHTARWNLALLQLLTGDYRQGFINFEARFLKGEPVDLEQVAIPSWDGREPLAGKRLLVQCEQGFGDTIQFVRYLPLLAERGAHVVVLCQGEELRTLVAGVQGVATVVVRGERVPWCDLRVPLLSLPRILGTTVDSIPARVPYLHVDAGRLEAWRDAVPEDGSMNVGLVWWGRSKPDPGRSIRLSELAPLGEVPGLRFYSLQVGGGSEQRIGAPFEVNDLTRGIGSFFDTAALISRLDLVISIDSAVAHLAGALGRPTWVLLPFAPDWRWFLHREDSPWYPSMRLFRQEKPGEWGAAVARLVRALRQVSVLGPGGR